tara:strand:- start:29 stop:298 length:270 start_codon:yes stop_codon:yes gene_type:complete
MLHSKFNHGIDLEERSVTINIHHLVNNERMPFSTTFYFDKDGNLELPMERDSNTRIVYLARHIKSTSGDLKTYLEDEYLREKSYIELPF